MEPIAFDGQVAIVTGAGNGLGRCSTTPTKSFHDVQAKDRLTAGAPPSTTLHSAAVIDVNYNVTPGPAGELWTPS
jgi:hypothetical protein